MSGKPVIEKFKKIGSVFSNEGSESSDVPDIDLIVPDSVLEPAVTFIGMHRIKVQSSSQVSHNLAITSCHIRVNAGWIEMTLNASECPVGRFFNCPGVL